MNVYIYHVAYVILIYFLFTLFQLMTIYVGYTTIVSLGHVDSIAKN